ncbi:hypothetical protein F5887DRAFT_922876 [Amanita rubescens]|nr:hypothetical protein F5887DRAFT_922876 [Amanita rubescens]
MTVVGKVYWNQKLHSFATPRPISGLEMIVGLNASILVHAVDAGNTRIPFTIYAHRDDEFALFFPELPESSVLVVQYTIPSPLEYGRRTKLIDAPPKEHRLEEAEV